MSKALTRDLLDRLRRHYIKPGANPPGGIFLEECGINGGTGAGSRCDALYVGFTSTSGRLLVGHEVKVTRADWRRELDQAGKADQWADNVHEWWIVAPGPDVVPREELPAGWGLMYPNTRTRTRMDKIVAPVRHLDREPSWVVVRSILARLDTLARIERSEYREQLREEQRAELAERVEQARKAGISAADRERLAQLDDLEARLGLPISQWHLEGLHPDQLVALVKLLHTGRRVDQLAEPWGLEHVRAQLGQVLESLDQYDAARAAFASTLELEVVQ